MNRVILIGNGFDLAHGLKTSYTNFMDWYWKKFAREFSRYRVFPFEDDLVKFYWTNGEPVYCTSGIHPDHFFIKVQQSKSYDDIKQLIDENNRFDGLQFILTFKNDFWKHISEKIYLGKKWVDIETEYYNELKSYLNDEDRNRKVKKLNSEFEQIKRCLEKYLTEVCENKEVKKIDSIKNDIEEKIKYSDIAISKRELFFNLSDDTISKISDCYVTDPNFKRDVNGELDEASKQHIIRFGLPPLQTLFLNFNYTNTAELYKKPTDCSLINIHGELNSKDNPIIFGYGDELDDDYREIEKINDNNFLDNIKSIQYHNTSNYREFLEFLQRDTFQVFIMGHSCGNSDRTLLNTIFEHPNCASIKPFYWDKGNGTDNYTDIIKNISRSFSNKQNMRDIVVDKKRCEALVPLKQEVNVHN